MISDEGLGEWWPVWSLDVMRWIFAGLEILYDLSWLYGSFVCLRWYRCVVGMGDGIFKLYLSLSMAAQVVVG